MTKSFFAGAIGALVVSSVAVAGSLQTVTIDFDDQPGGLPPVETDGMFSPHATFSTESGHVMLIFSGAGVVGGSNPNVLTAAVSATASDFDSDIYVDFTEPVQNLSLDLLSDNDSGTIATLTVLHSGGTTMLDVVGNGDFSDPMPFDLSSYTDVTRVELTNITDEFGLSMDNLVFDVPTSSGAGLLAAAGVMAMRRRRRA
ncbi:MAG: hypothetical protein RIB32_03980 [Phycisphaerales bacterium]